MARQNPVDEHKKGVSITVRVTPRTKFVIDLLTKSQHRSVTALFESFVARAEEDEFVHEDEGGPRSLVDMLWDTDDISRLVNLASIAPKFMTYEEQVLWRVMRDEPLFWVETQREFPLHVPEGETDQEERDRLNQFFESSLPFRYKVVDVRFFHGVHTEYWLDMLLARKAWPDIQRVANQEITGDELSAIVAELANTLQGTAMKHRAPPPIEDEFG